MSNPENGLGSEEIEMMIENEPEETRPEFSSERFVESDEMKQILGEVQQGLPLVGERYERYMRLGEAIADQVTGDPVLGRFQLNLSASLLKARVGMTELALEDLEELAIIAHEAGYLDFADQVRQELNSLS